jgi:hypothetical protein
MTGNVDIASSLRETVIAARPALLAIPESRAREKASPSAWSFEEILGHLIDSAANNHQRIVRMQETQNIGRFVYTQRHWVDAQRYNAEPWRDLVEFWCSYNTHIAHVIVGIEPAALHNLCDMGYARPAPLEFVIEDYLRHVRHHLGQILAEVPPGKRTAWVRRDPPGGADPPRQTA